MSSSSLPKTGLQTVESFQLCLDDLGEVLHAESPAKWLEAQLLSRLTNPVRLLRWAIVNVEESPEGRRFWCEGAYLKRSK
jgi:hypothetical protein